MPVWSYDDGPTLDATVSYLGLTANGSAWTVPSRRGVSFDSVGRDRLSVEISLETGEESGFSVAEEGERFLCEKRTRRSGIDWAAHSSWLLRMILMKGWYHSSQMFDASGRLPRIFGAKGVFSMNKVVQSQRVVRLTLEHKPPSPEYLSTSISSELSSSNSSCSCSVS